MKIDLNRLNRKRLDKEKLMYFISYFKQNFNSRFRPNSGTEIILNIISKLNNIDKWIDLGAGTSSLFWALPMNEINYIVCNDITTEPFYLFKKEILRKNILPICYYDVLKMYNICDARIEDLKSKFLEFHIFDAMNSWSFDSNLKFDLITQFGTFGLSKNAESYIKCIDYAFENLKIKGNILGANWILKKNLSKHKNIDNRYLNTNLITNYSQKKKCRIIENMLVEIDDINYKSILIWFLQKE